ncbi:MAG: hypothetical protein ACOX3B_03445 [Bacilli bacterium]|jgi:hypothetical protein|nr:hypothetical protein [Bacillota bacterium]
MKLRKIVFLPLLLVALASCDGAGGKISREVANTRVTAALEKTVNETFKSIDLAVDLDAVISHKAVDEANVVIEEDKIEVSGNATVKAKDLDKETAQFAITGSGSYALYHGSEKALAVEGEGGIYYTDEFVYLGLTASMFDGESGRTETESLKQKMEVGPFPGLPDLDDFEGQLPGPEVEIEGPGDIGELLPAIGTVTATEKKGVLTVKYEVKQADLAQLVFEVLAPEIGDMTSSELAEALEDLQEMIDESVLIRKAVVTVVVGAEGYINGLTVDVDFDAISDYHYWDDTAQDYLVAVDTTTVKGKLDVSLKINEAVAITFPSFADYVLVEEIGLVN